MQWDRSHHAGFTSGTPWLPLSEDYEQLNVEVERDAPDSMLTLYRELLLLRRREPALHRGSVRIVEDENELLAFVREHESRRVLVILNFSGALRALDPRFFTALRSEVTGASPRARVLLSTAHRNSAEPLGSEDTIRGNEGLVLELDAGTVTP
jgi:alpha-glucosidase